MLGKRINCNFVDYYIKFNYYSNTLVNVSPPFPLFWDMYGTRTVEANIKCIHVSEREQINSKLIGSENLVDGVKAMNFPCHAKTRTLLKYPLKFKCTEHNTLLIRGVWFEKTWLCTYTNTTVKGLHLLSNGFTRRKGGRIHRFVYGERHAWLDVTPTKKGVGTIYVVYIRKTYWKTEHHELHREGKHMCSRR